MTGHVLNFSAQDQTGIITATDGSRYSFAQAAWKDSSPPSRGMAVDFEVQGGEATNLYKAIDSGSQGAVSGKKSKIAAGLFAIFLGGFGIHKFYLGYTGPGLVYLLVNTVGWCVTVFMLGIPNMALGVMALIEGILYLTKTDEEFEETYVKNRKSWF
jgi:TM2 domain-containing membrane protein YozV